MSEPIKKIEDILKSAYSTEGFVEFIKEIFDSIKIIAPDKKNKEYSNFNSHIETYSHIGSYASPDGKKIAVFEVQLKAANYVENARSTQRSYARKLIENGNVDGAIIAFFTPGDSKWRLSFVRLDYEMKFEGGNFKTQENLTPAKRYSFLVGKDEPCHTAISRFYNFIIDKNYNPTLDDIEEAFSVEKVTKEFFALYCEKFYQLQEYLEGNRDFREESERCGFSSEQFAKKLMGQIVFLYFLQKKGWLGVGVWPKTLAEKEYKNVFFTSGAQGRIIRDHLPEIYIQQEDGLYHLNSHKLDEISDEDEEVIANHMPRAKTWGDGSKNFLRTIYAYSQTHKKHFYEEYLEPLFYDTLNRNRGAMGYCPALHCRIPFLSGGLFDPIDNYDWKNNHFDIPDEIFSNRKSDNDRDADGILDIFDRYNFTMSEDEPMEREVAIDPEMLGKVFENLLEVKDRKSKGAFYTPREIVHYMCQESLINYLVRKTGLKETDIRDFILYGDFMKDEDTTKEKREGNGGMYISEEIFKIDADSKIIVNRLSEIDDALANVKVADPAVGSGAFPLGMMNEIVRARQNITAYMSIGMNAYNKRMLYQNDRTPYILKYNTIKNCLYAVDIEPSAVDIAQLRLWLSLVIDDEINPNAQNDLEGHRDPLPLPNLECNILCGNSLIDEFKGMKLVKPSDILGTMIDVYELEFGQNDFEFILKKMLEEQDLLFRCDDPIKKLKHKEAIQSYKDMIVSKKIYGDPTLMAEYKKATAMSSKPFIVWELDFARVFRDNGGFDIVIGNPPYVSTKGRDTTEKKEMEKIYGYADDYYYHFIDKAFIIACTEGSICYITPDTYYTTLTKAELRKKLLNNRIISLVQLGHDVFESAMVSTAILLVAKESATDNSVIRCIDVKNKPSLSHGDEYTITYGAFRKAINGSFYMPTPFNTALNNSLYDIHTELIRKYFPLISTSREIEKNANKLSQYRKSLFENDWTLIGLVTEGGQGMATANNGRFVGVREGTKEAIRIRNTRLDKFSEFNATYHFDYQMPTNEKEIWELFENLKDKYGRDIFGQGYLYKIVPPELIRDTSTLSQDEKDQGIVSGPTFVTYDKGDKDGNRWYNETPYLIDWSRENVHFLKSNSGKKGIGMPVVRNPQFYFREGFAYSDIKTFFLKCRLKGISVHDVKSMSLFPVCDKIPYYYIITLLNSEVIATIVYNFLNNTPSFQMNDCRMLPIKVPTEQELSKCKELFDKSVDVQKKFFAGCISQETRNQELAITQQLIDEWACGIYGIPVEYLKGQQNIVR